MERADGQAGTGRLGADIAQSWHRARLSGLAPSQPLDDLPLTAVDGDCRLARAAGPVLDDMAEKLAHTKFAVLLADRESRIVGRRASHDLERQLDCISAVPGCRYVEDSTGTNSLATAFELGRGVAVSGPEHFLEALRPFCCYGHPIRHPVGRWLEGVLAITGPTEDANPLMRPFLERGINDIEQRLLEIGRQAHQRLLTAFRRSARRTQPVVVVGDDIVLANRAAIDLLHSADHATFRQLATDPPRRSAVHLTLSSGVSALTRIERIPGAHHGLLFELSTTRRHIERERAGTAPSDCYLGAAVARQLESCPDGTATLVSGPPGSGRSWAARFLARGKPVTTFHAADVATTGSDTGTWLRRLKQLLDHPRGALVVEEAHLLPNAAAVEVSRILADKHAWLILTSALPCDLDGVQAALASQCLERIQLSALRSRAADIPATASAMLSTRHPNQPIRLTSSTLDVLAAHDWPGNLRELADVLDYLADRHQVGDITPAHLPSSYRSLPRRRGLTPLERAEHDAIVAALHETGGNKLRASQRLGISRSTLYERMRALSIHE